MMSRDQELRSDVDIKLPTYVGIENAYTSSQN
jgi:hypothetical protein